MEFFHLTLVFPLLFVKVKSLTFLFFFHLPSLFSVKNHKVLTLFQRRKVLNESCMSCPEWEGREYGAPWWRPLATAGLWFQVRLWTHAARSWMAPRPPPETWGQGPATSIQPPDLPPWPLENRKSPLYLGHQSHEAHRAVCVTGVIYRKRDRWPEPGKSDIFHGL